ncbi:MAG TPA: 5-formyltetrahydrofolate cyclo-ligase [Saprospiraceae bacterium]|nr:5-formyltetrahydrofolate cyclo-ligase [Saprospiraceae bacterium]
MIKQEIRKRMLEKRKLTSPETKLNWDDKINGSLIDWILKHDPQTVHCYLPMPEEVDLTTFLKKCLQSELEVIVPKVKRRPFLEHLILNNLQELESGPMGTRHPEHALPYTGDLELIIVPGLAFDHLGYRIGYGGAYYDHFLANYPNAFKLAVCYPYQLLPELPREAHDIAVDRILCPQAPHRFNYEWEKVHFI